MDLLDQAEKLVETLKEQGIVISIEQAMDLLKQCKAEDATATNQDKPYQLIRGYKVYVEYEPITMEEMRMKQSIVARIVAGAMQKPKEQKDK